MVELAVWPTDSGRLNRKVVTHPASSLTQDRQSSPAETSVLTTMLRRNVKGKSYFQEWSQLFHAEGARQPNTLLSGCY